MKASHDLSEEIKTMRRVGHYMPHDGWYWSENDVEKLKMEFSDGTGISQIAVELQKSELAVMQEIEKLDLYERKDFPKRHRRPRASKGYDCHYCNGDCDNCPIANSNDPEQEVQHVQ